MKNRKRLVSMLCAAAMLLSLFAEGLVPMTALAAGGPASQWGLMDPVSAGETFTKTGGYANGLFAEWAPVTGAAGYKGYVKKSADSAWTQLDDPLIRKYSDHWRLDALGLAKGNYDVKVEAFASATASSPLATITQTGIQVTTHDRHGFAFTDVNGKLPGAYKQDGTLQDKAKVIYVDNTNFNTVTWEINKDSKGTKLTLTGVQGIVNNSGFWKYAQYNDYTAVDIRVIGLVNATGFPAASWGSSSEGLQIKGDGKVSTPLTIEGVGNDATIHGFGLFARSTSYVELANLGIMCFKDDGVSLDTDNLYTWVHNCDIFYGSTGGDSDQAKGDGSLDVKGDSKFQTYSYNHFWDSGKASLCGMKSESGENFITYHHNWFDHSDSRHPRVRTMSVHSYNNFYDGNSKYGAGAAYKSSIFVDSNYFRNCQYPMLSSMQGSDVFAGGTAYSTDHATFSSEDGGIIKAYGNVFEGPRNTVIPYNSDKYLLKGQSVDYNLAGTTSTEHFDAYFVDDRNATVPDYVKAYQGGSTYTNFDTKEDLGVTEADIDDANDVPSKVMSLAGRVEGGDFWWDLGTDIPGEVTPEDLSYAVDTGLKAKLVDYKTALVAIGGFAGTVLPSSVSDPSFVRETGDRAEVLGRYGEDNMAAREAAQNSPGSGGGGAVNVFTPLEGFDFKASEFLTTQGADTTTDSHSISDTPIDYGQYTLTKVNTIKGKTDRISLSKTSGVLTVKEVPIFSATDTKTVIRFVMSTDGAEKTSYYAVTGPDSTVVKSGSINGTGDNTIEVEVEAAGDYILKYDPDNAATTNQLRLISATVGTITQQGGDPVVDDNDYSVTVDTGEGVTLSQAPEDTCKKGATVSFKAAVSDPENYDLSVTVTRASGSGVKVTENNGTYTFTMPASNVTVTLEAISKAGPDEPVEPETVYHDVIFKWEDDEKSLQVEDGKTIAADDVPDSAQIEGFEYWALDGQRIEPAGFAVYSDMTITAVVKKTSYTENDEFVSKTYLNGIDAWSGAFGTVDSKGLTAPWNSWDEGHEGYNPLKYGPFTFVDWKIPSKKKDAIAIRMETGHYGRLEIAAPAASVLYIKGSSSSSGKNAYFTITGPDGRTYTGKDANGEPKDNKFSSSATELYFNLGIAGVYTFEYDGTKSDGVEARFVAVTLDAEVDEEADPYHMVTFKDGDKVVSVVKKTHGDFLDLADFPTPSMSAGDEFNGWYQGGDPADALMPEQLAGINVMKDITFNAAVEKAESVVTYTVGYSISGNVLYKETVKAGDTLSDIPVVSVPAGASFKGWSETENGTLINTDTWVPAADDTLYAVIEKVSTEPRAWVYDVTAHGITDSNATDVYTLTDTSSTKTGTDSMFVVSGSLKSSTELTSGTVTVNPGLTCGPYPSSEGKYLKMEKDTSITFTAPNDGCTLYVFTDTLGTNVKLDDVKVTAPSGDKVVTIPDIKKGSHAITKGDSINVGAFVLVDRPESTKYVLSVSDSNFEGVESSLIPGEYLKGTVVSFSAKPGKGYKDLKVTKIIGSDETTSLEPDGDGLYSVTMDSNLTIGLKADADTTEKYSVEVRYDGASSDLTPDFYPSGHTISFKARLNPGYKDLDIKVDGITGEGASATATDKTAACLMHNPDGSYSLTINDYNVIVYVYGEHIYPTGLAITNGTEEIAEYPGSPEGTLEVEAGASLTLSTNVLPAEAVCDVLWTSGDEKIAKVSRGRIIPIAAGATVITAKVDGHDDIAVNIALRVTEPQPESASIKCNGSEISEDLPLNLHSGDTAVLTPSVLPAGVKYTATFESGTTSVATMEGGRLTAVGAGEAVITLTVKGAGADAATLTAKAKVVVTDIVPTGLTLKDSEGNVLTPDSTVALKVGDKYPVTADITPSNATVGALSYSSGSPLIAEVNESTGEVTALAAGTSTITATLSWLVGGAEKTLTQSFSVSITEQGQPDIIPTELTLKDSEGNVLTADSTVALKVGDKFPVTAERKPEGAIGTVTFESDKPSIAAVGQTTGEVTAVSAGTAQITARLVWSTAGQSETGQMESHFKVKVTSSGPAPTPSTEDVEMLPGEVKRLNLFENHYTYPVRWTLESADPKGCVTLKNGIVTAKPLKKGVTEAKAVVKAAYCGETYTYNITVNCQVPEAKAILNGKKKIELKAAKKLSLNVGDEKKKSVTVKIPAELREGVTEGSIAHEVTVEGVCEIGEPVFDAKRTKATFEVDPVDAGATYIIWSMTKEEEETVAVTEEEEKTVAVTEVIVKKPRQENDFTIAQTMDLSVGEIGMILVEDTANNTDPKDLSFSVKGKGIKVSKSGAVAAVIPGSSGTVTVKAGKIKREVEVTVSGDHASDYLMLNKALLSVKPGKKGKTASLTLKRVVTPKKKVELPGISEIQVQGDISDQGIKGEADKSKPGKINVTVPAGTVPGTYLIVVEPEDTELNPVCCELIVK